MSKNIIYEYNTAAKYDAIKQDNNTKYEINQVTAKYNAIKQDNNTKYEISQVTAKYDAIIWNKSGYKMASAWSHESKGTKLSWLSRLRYHSPQLYLVLYLDCM